MPSKASWSRLNEEAGIDEASAKRIARYVDKDIETLSNCKPALLAEKAAVTVGEAEKAIAWAKIQPIDKPQIHQTIIHREGGVNLGDTARRDIHGDVIGRDKVETVVNGVPVDNTPQATPDPVNLDELEAVEGVTSANAVILCQRFRSYTDIAELKESGVLRGMISSLGRTEAANIMKFAKAHAYGAIDPELLAKDMEIDLEVAQRIYDEFWTFFELADSPLGAITSTVHIDRDLANEIVQFAKGKVLNLKLNDSVPSRGHSIVVGDVKVDGGSKMVMGDDNSRGGMPQSFYDAMANLRQRH